MFVESFKDPDVSQSKCSTSTQQKTRPSKGDLCVAKEFQLVVNSKAINVGITDKSKLLCNFINVIFNQCLGTDMSAFVELKRQIRGALVQEAKTFGFPISPKLRDKEVLRLNIMAGISPFFLIIRKVFNLSRISS